MLKFKTISKDKIITTNICQLLNISNVSLKLMFNGIVNRVLKTEIKTKISQHYIKFESGSITGNDCNFIYIFIRH